MSPYIWRVKQKQPRPMKAFDTNVFEEPGIRRHYRYVGNGCNIQGELMGSDLGDGTYKFSCHFAFNVLHAPEFVNLRDLQPISSQQ